MKLYLFAAVAAFLKPASSTWTTVYSEDVGYGNGAEYDDDPIRTLSLSGLPSYVAGGDYRVRMEWGESDFAEFKVPAGSNIFSQIEGDIAITDYTDSTDITVIGSEALFCVGCVEGGTKKGDTCWGVTPVGDTNRHCGCNSGGWSGQGIYYGGYKNPDVCGAQGGGFVGPKAPGMQKGNLPSVGLILKVKSVRVFDFCSNERSKCTCYGTTRFGSAVTDSWVEQDVNGEFDCERWFFGGSDPAVGQIKTCECENWNAPQAVKYAASGNDVYRCYYVDGSDVVERCQVNNAATRHKMIFDAPEPTTLTLTDTLSHTTDDGFVWVGSVGSLTAQLDTQSYKFPTECCK